MTALRPLFLLLLCVGACVAEGHGPEQINIQLGSSPTELIFSWYTMNETWTSEVELSEEPDVAEAETVLRALGEPSETPRTYRFPADAAVDYYQSAYVHTVRVSGLTPGATYYYRVGGVPNTEPKATPSAADDDAAVRGDALRAAYQDVPRHFSRDYDTTLQSADGKRELCVAFTGGVGTSNSAALLMTHLAQLAAEPIDAVFVAGDITFSVGNRRASPDNPWDRFQAMRHALARGWRHPWTFAAGAHDADGGEAFVPFTRRLAQPNNGLWFAVDYESLHVLVISTAHAYTPGSEQYVFIDDDLRRAARPAARARRPWLVVLASAAPFCTAKRHNSDFTMRAALQPLFDRYRVDFVVGGRAHVYERTLPLRDGTRVLAAHERRAHLAREVNAVFSFTGNVSARGGTIYATVGVGGDSVDGDAADDADAFVWDEDVDATQLASVAQRWSAARDATQY